MIEQQFAELETYLRNEKKLAATLERLSTGAYLVTVKGVRVASGWQPDVVDILFIAPPGYPAARPDCFWVTPPVRLAAGAMAMNANDATPIPGDPQSVRPTTWFSWHLQSWDPNVDKLVTFYNATVRRMNPAR